MSTEPVELKIEVHKELHRESLLPRYNLIIHSDVSNTRSPIEFEFPFTPEQHKEYADQLDYLLLRTRFRFHNQNLDPYIKGLKQYGTVLFEKLLGQGEARRVYNDVKQEASEQNRPLRISLRFEHADELADLSWELLYDPHIEAFLSLHGTTSIVRYLSPPRVRGLETVKPPLRILMVAAVPDSSYAIPLDVERERQRLEQAIDKLRMEGFVEIDYVNDGTLETLSKKLRQTSYHVVHYAGHAMYSVESEMGVAVFADNNGKPHLVTAEKLRDVLTACSKSLRLVVINACNGGRASASDMYSSIAGKLVLLGVPSVISMQHPIYDNSAIKFTQELYAALVEGDYIDIAATKARKAMIELPESTWEWATPLVHAVPSGVKVFEQPNEEIQKSAEEYRQKREAAQRAQKLEEIRIEIEEKEESARKEREEQEILAEKLRAEERHRLQQEHEEHVRQLKHEAAQIRQQAVLENVRKTLAAEEIRTQELLLASDRGWQLELENAVRAEARKAKEKVNLLQAEWQTKLQEKVHETEQYTTRLMRERAEGDRATIVAKHKIQLAEERENARNDAWQAAQKQIDELQQKHLREIDELQQKHLGKMVELNQKHQVAVKQAKAAAWQKAQQQINVLQGEISKRRIHWFRLPIPQGVATVLTLVVTTLFLFLALSVGRTFSAPIPLPMPMATAALAPTRATAIPLSPVRVLQPTATTAELVRLSPTTTPALVATLLPTEPPSPVCADPGSLIAAPRVDQVVSGTLALRGTATHSLFESYRLEYAPGASAIVGYQAFAENRQPVVDGELGAIDTHNLTNGLWTLRLVVVDQLGNFLPPCQVTVAVQN